MTDRLALTAARLHWSASSSIHQLAILANDCKAPWGRLLSKLWNEWKRDDACVVERHRLRSLLLSILVPFTLVVEKPFFLILLLDSFKSAWLLLPTSRSRDLKKKRTSLKKENIQDADRERVNIKGAPKASQFLLDRSSSIYRVGHCQMAENFHWDQQKNKWRTVETSRRIRLESPRRPRRRCIYFLSC